MGLAYALIGAALALIGGGIGSSVGVSWASQAAAGVVSEDPDKFGKTMIFQLIPSSNALYGFIVAFLVFMQTILGGNADVSVAKGLQYLAVCLPVAVVGSLAAVMQAKVCVSCINMVGKNSELSGRGLTMAAFIELFALLSLVISIFGIFQIK